MTNERLLVWWAMEFLFASSYAEGIFREFRIICGGKEEEIGDRVSPWRESLSGRLANENEITLGTPTTIRRRSWNEEIGKVFLSCPCGIGWWTRGNWIGFFFTGVILSHKTLSIANFLLVIWFSSPSWTCRLIQLRSGGGRFALIIYEHWLSVSGQHHKITTTSVVYISSSSTSICLGNADIFRTTAHGQVSTIQPIIIPMARRGCGALPID